MSRSMCVVKLGVVAAIMGLTAACSPPADPDEPEDAGATTEDSASEAETEVEARPENGNKSITIATHVEPTTLESAEAFNSFNGSVLKNIFEPLVERDRETNEFIPALATSWEQVDDPTWEFELRTGVTFHDGSELTAQSVATALDHVYTGEVLTEGARNYAPGSMEFTAVDVHTLQVVTEVIDPLLPGTLYAAPIPSGEQIQNDLESYGSEPIGTGPYKFISWDRGSSIELELNEDWWGFDSEHGLGEPYYERATFLFRPDPSSRIAAIRAGEAALAERLPPDSCLNDLGDQCVPAPQSDVVFIKLDMPSPVFGDERARSS